MSLSAPSLLIVNARVVLADTVLERATVRVDDGHIAAIEEQGASRSLPTPEGATIVDANGAMLMPGVVDLHNDNLEFEINPRHAVGLPLPFALATMERRLASAGVTTEFHAISFQERVDKQRSVINAETKAAFLSRFDDSAERPVRHNILHRLDMRTEGSLASALPTLQRARTPYISLNDHTPGQGQYRDVDRLITMAEASHTSRGDTKPFDASWYLQRMQENLGDTDAVDAFYASIAEALTHTPMVISTHDDDTIQKVEAQRILGATVAEFPITIEAAQYARDGGMAIVVGAPNIVRGGSQSGNLSAVDLVAANLADAICADYHAPCLIPAALKLVELGLRDLPAAIAMITRNPARAVGLDDRGEIAIGQLADLVLLRIDELGIPQVEGTFVEGRQVLAFNATSTSNKPVAAASANGDRSFHCEHRHPTIPTGKLRP
ncbi:MAG: alpha-D-ribose 1-methylphosphonate 5-triphosphate diphosphatase [Thermomicrobiales bacterium]